MWLPNESVWNIARLQIQQQVSPRALYRSVQFDGTLHSDERIPPPHGGSEGVITTNGSPKESFRNAEHTVGSEVETTCVWMVIPTTPKGLPSVAMSGTNGFAPFNTWGTLLTEDQVSEPGRTQTQAGGGGLVAAWISVHTTIDRRSTGMLNVNVGGVLSPQSGNHVRTPRIPHQRKAARLFSCSIPMFRETPLIPDLLKVMYKRYRLLKVDAYVQRGIRLFG